MAKPTRSAVEIHLDGLLRGCKDLWLGYKKWLQRVQILLKKLEPKGGFSVDEGDSYIRFSATDEFASLNHLFFVCEIGRVIPTLRWRHLIRSSRGLTYVLLQKPVSYLPAFSFSLDKLVTLIYWGERDPFLSTLNLRKLKLGDFALNVINPSLVDVSAANLIWPRSAYPISCLGLERLAGCYIFNSLRPPMLSSIAEVWSESPIVLVGDRNVTLITIHKTLCTINQKTVKPLERQKVLNARAYIIDRNFSVKRTPVDIPLSYAGELFDKEKEAPFEVIFVKFIKFRHDPSVKEGRPYIRYVIYPFESVKLFGTESFGKLLSLTSMMLRESYLESEHPFKMTVTPDRLRKCFESVMQLPFSNVRQEEFGFRVLERKNGNKAVALALGIYDFDGEEFTYFPPALLECFSKILENQVDRNKLLGLLKVATRYLEERPRTPVSPILIEKWFENEVGVRINFTQASSLRRPLYTMTNVVIPLSKGLNL